MNAKEKHSLCDFQHTAPKNQKKTALLQKLKRKDATAHAKISPAQVW
jgi:hypothetical protein